MAPYEEDNFRRTLDEIKRFIDRAKTEKLKKSTGKPIVSIEHIFQVKNMHDIELSSGKKGFNAISKIHRVTLKFKSVKSAYEIFKQILSQKLVIS